MNWKRNTQKYKVETLSNVMTEIELNKIYFEGWELINIITVSKNSFTHIFKKK